MQSKLGQMGVAKWGVCRRKHNAFYFKLIYKIRYFVKIKSVVGIDF